jgi:hypothetical protein
MLADVLAKHWDASRPVKIVIERPCPHGRTSWHWIGAVRQSATCTWGTREVRYVGRQ